VLGLEGLCRDLLRVAGVHSPARVNRILRRAQRALLADHEAPLWQAGQAQAAWPLPCSAQIGDGGGRADHGRFSYSLCSGGNAWETLPVYIQGSFGGT
jgi:hypothetical protein